MTDKQIIIDGVDVSGCIYYKATGKYNTCGYDCELTHNCYYKQLKAKEQECKELETARHLIETSRYNWEYRAKSKERECESLNRWLPIISRLEMAFGSYEKAKAIDFASYTKQIFAELDQLKAELEQEKALKETYLACYKAKHEDIEGELFNLKAENDELKKYIKHLHNLCGNETDKQYKLKQTLTEIKEICNSNDELKGDFNLVDCDKYKLGKHNLANKILQKISEVVDET